MNTDEDSEMHDIFKDEGAFRVPPIPGGLTVASLFRLDNAFVRFRYIGENFRNDLNIVGYRESPPEPECIMYRYGIRESVRVQTCVPEDVFDRMLISHMRLYQMIARQPSCQPGDLRHENHWNLVILEGGAGYPKVNAAEGIQGAWTMSQTFRHADGDCVQLNAARGDMRVIPFDLREYLGGI